MRAVLGAASTLWSIADRRARLLVVSVHRVGGRSGFPVRVLEEHLRHLAKNYRVVLPAHLGRTPPSSRLAMVTVDDAHDDVYNSVYPMIKALRIPVVLCVSTDFFLRGRWLWFDKLRWVLGAPRFAHAGDTKERAAWLEEVLGANVSLKNLKQLPPRRCEELIARLAQWAGVAIPVDPVEGFQAIREQAMHEMLDSGLVEIASHTVSHAVLTALDDEELAQETATSRRELERFSGRAVRTFCYPNGLPGDYDRRTRAALAQAGYEIAFTSSPGLNYFRDLDLMELSRVHVHRELGVFRRMASGLPVPLKIPYPTGEPEGVIRPEAGLPRIGSPAGPAPAEGLWQVPAGHLRGIPFPYRAMVAICSDLDGTPEGPEYFSMLRYLNTRGRSRIGEGVGLEIGNSIYFDVAPPQFCYWNTSEERKEMLRCLIRSGHVDCLHSFGTRAMSRADAARALAELQRHGCQLSVWVDHGKAPTNFGPDIMRGSGDLVGATAYHADLTIAYGIKYVWRGRVTSIIGQDLTWSLGGLFRTSHPVASGLTVAKELTKKLASSERYAMNRTNRIMRQTTLRDGRVVREFLRSNPHWGGIDHGDTADDIPSLLDAKILDRLVKRGGVAVLYTHLGKTREPAQIFSRTARAAWELLARYQAEGRILVTTTKRLLEYRWLLDRAEVTPSESPADPAVRVMVQEEGIDLSGLCCYVRDPATARLFVNGQEVRSIQRNAADHTGCASVSIPWRRLEFPPASEVPG